MLVRIELFMRKFASFWFLNISMLTWLDLLLPALLTKTFPKNKINYTLIEFMGSNVGNNCIKFNSNKYVESDNRILKTFVIILDKLYLY